MKNQKLVPIIVGVVVVAAIAVVTAYFAFFRSGGGIEGTWVAKEKESDLGEMELKIAGDKISFKASADESGVKMDMEFSVKYEVKSEEERKYTLETSEFTVDKFEIDAENEEDLGGMTEDEAKELFEGLLESQFETDDIMLELSEDEKMLTVTISGDPQEFERK